jgi:hypothetical protein
VAEAAKAVQNHRRKWRIQPLSGKEKQLIPYRDRDPF